LLFFFAYKKFSVKKVKKVKVLDRVEKSRRKDYCSQGSRSVRANKYLEEKTPVVKGAEDQLK